jgi:prepilin-type processing-associated H-X9-DG protein
MIIRLFRAKPKAGKSDELATLVKDVSIAFVDGHAGLIARHPGRSMATGGEEIVMISVWKDLDAMKAMTGENWQDAVIPDERFADLIESCSVEHYESIT